MSKRPTTSDMEADVLSPQKSAAVAHGDDTVPLKAGTTKKADAANGDVDMGEFEDAWDDELVSEDEGDVVDCASESDEDEAGNGMAVDDEDQGDDEEDKEPEVKVYLPGQALAADEQLEVDNSAYMMLHDLKVEWPCLSFDFVGYGADADSLNYPLTTYAVAGTQAAQFGRNSLMILKMSRLHKTQNDGRGDLDSDQEEDEDADDTNAADEDPILESQACKHQGGVNRVRATTFQNRCVAATWAETGKVHIWDIESHLQALTTPGFITPAEAKLPIYTVQSHGRHEGFAMDWSHSHGGLLTGDMNSNIYVTQRDASTGAFRPDRIPFAGHTSSVEDLQWSPTERNVFASASADQTVRIWDCRQKKRPAITVHAHDADVNVISWNRNASYLLASGSDDGVLSIWDMRSFTSKDAQKQRTPVASFKWHRAPITSVEWHPTEESVLAASGADDQITLWDLSVEHDAEEMQEMNAAAQMEVPPQLLFIHQGQTDIKEIHWHPKKAGVLMSTAGSGFNIFKTISV